MSGAATTTSTAQTKKTTTIKVKKLKTSTAASTTSATTKAATYVSVPLESESSSAELDFSGFDGDLALSVDSDGDGVTDATISPDAVLDTFFNAGHNAPRHYTAGRSRGSGAKQHDDVAVERDGCRVRNCDHDGDAERRSGRERRYGDIHRGRQKCSGCHCV